LPKPVFKRADSPSEIKSGDRLMRIDFYLLLPNDKPFCRDFEMIFYFLIIN